MRTFCPDTPFGNTDATATDTVSVSVNVSMTSCVSVSVRCTCTCDCTSILFWWVRKCANILALSRDCSCVSLSVCVSVYLLAVCVHLLAVCRCVSAVCVVFSYWRQALHSSFFSSSVSYLFLVLSIFRLAAGKGFFFRCFSLPPQLSLYPTKIG